MQHPLPSTMPIKASVSHYPCDDSAAESANKTRKCWCHSVNLHLPKKAMEAQICDLLQIWTSLVKCTQLCRNKEHKTESSTKCQCTMHTSWTTIGYLMVLWIQVKYVTHTLSNMCSKMIPQKTLGSNLILTQAWIFNPCCYDTKAIKFTP
jgi:hypothetical protein